MVRIAALVVILVALPRITLGQAASASFVQLPSNAPSYFAPASTVADPDGEYAYRLPAAGEAEISIVRSGQDVGTVAVGAYPIVKPAPYIRGVVMESRCVTASFTCQLRLFRSGVLAGIATIPMGSILSDEISGEWLVAMSPTGVTRIRTVDMVVDRTIVFEQRLEPLDAIVIGRGALKSFVLVGTAVVVVDIDRNQVTGTLNMVGKDSPFVSAMKTLGLVGLAGVAVLIDPTAALDAVSASGRTRSVSGERETELTLTPSGDVEVRHRPTDRLIVLDGVTGAILWDTHNRQN